jgi:glycosyltransferase involved in cell wall biosynthesis
VSAPGARADGEPLRVGFLHLGRPTSGVRRYGRILAAETARRPDLAVLERSVEAADAPLRDLRDAGRALREADVLHLQWRLADWGARTGGLPRLEAVLRGGGGRPLVVTLHDVVEPRSAWGRRFSPSALGLRRLGRAADRLVVHLEEERRRLAGMVPAERVAVVPHFVEERPPLPGRDEARRALGLEGRRVVTLLGFITRRKGHQLLMDALAHLPDDVVALFVGSVIEGRDHVMAAMREHARERGVADRVRFTGFVPDDELPLHLAATDVAACPFRDMSASGALSTWISTARPIVTSDLPAFRAYEALEPGALRIVEQPGPEALAACLLEALDEGGGREDPAVRRLAERLATPRIVERYAALYREVAGDR